MSAPEEGAPRRRWDVDGEKVVYSRSHLLFSGTKPLEDAFEVFVPESKHFMSSDTELWNFLCSLKRDFSPVILRSKDVYGYSSCRSIVPDPSQFTRGKPKDKPPAAAPPKKLPVKRKRRGMRLSSRKRRRGRTVGSEGTGGSEESVAGSTSGGSSVCSSPTPSEVQGLLHLGKSLEDIWKAATPKLTVFPTIRVSDVSCEAKVAAARRKAQKILQVNLQPVVKIRRFPILSPS
ncbi:coiled-coil domain-containing protein 71L [Spea bombifrons]|uniref:coiled-coil domain-containing protein 71L n=1 Tax=Spea bombifrons TaxID=233779 RepID=UPI0023495CD5|nr:coiled-coil domain-containing protein 71L [Spea bombifrons]